MDKDLLFFSNYDEYSIKIIETVKKNNIKDIIPICIDDSKIKIPSFITVVPTLYISSSKKLIIDEHINIFIENKQSKDNKNVDNLAGYNNTSFSNEYHNIDLDNHEQDSNLSTYFSDITINSIDKLDEEKILNDRPSNVDNFQKSRQEDISNIFNK